LIVEPKFVVDGMLGSLSRWLRMLGYEADYPRDVSDDELLELTASKRAILLTRDAELYRRAKVRNLEAFFVEGDDEPKRLANTATRYGLRLKISSIVSRCPTCNSPLRKAETDEIRERVPKGSLKHYSDFWVCMGCGKVYWQGGHWKKINETLRRARALQKNNRQ